MIRCFIFSQWFPHLELRNHLVFNTKELRWRSHSPAGSPDILDLVRCIVEEPWSEGCETLAVVYLEHLIAGFWQQQVAQFAAAGDVRGAYGMPRSNRYVAVAALGIVALHALGAENCLLLAVYCRCSIPPGTSIPIWSHSRNRSSWKVENSGCHTAKEILHQLGTSGNINTVNNGMIIGCFPSTSWCRISSTVTVSQLIEFFLFWSCASARLPLRVCRGVCTDPSVQEAARRKLEDRRAFRFLTYSGRKVAGIEKMPSMGISWVSWFHWDISGI